MQSFSCLAPGDDEESGEAKEEQARQEFDAFAPFLGKPLARSSDSDVILDTQIQILLAILVAV